MSMMKLMLPPVVSSGQYQRMESSTAMMEHMIMTDNAMIGPQWHNLRTSRRFSNVTAMENMFIFFLPQIFQLASKESFVSAILHTQQCGPRT